MSFGRSTSCSAVALANVPMTWPCSTGWRPSAWLAGSKSDVHTSFELSARSVWLHCSMAIRIRPDSYLSESLIYVETGASLRDASSALLFVAFFLAQQGDVIAAGRVYVELRHQRYIVDSVFCQQIAGRELEALLERLTPEQLAAVHAAPVPADLRALAAEMHAKLEALG